VSLRAKLLIGLFALVAVGLGAMATVTYEEQRSFLLTRVDQEVAEAKFPLSAGFGLVDARGPGVGAGPPQRRPGPAVSARGAATFQESGAYAELLDASGHVTKVKSFTPYGSAALSPPSIPRALEVTPLGAASPHLFTVNSKADSGLRYRVAAFSVSGGRTLVVAVSLRGSDQTLHSLLVVEGLVGGGVLLALLILGWIVIRFSLRPLEQIGRVASDIAHGDLSRRVAPVSQRTEVGRLGLSLNEMLVQIEQAFADRQASEDRLRQFLADASHELRTPLASIRGYAELFRIGAADDPESLERAMSRIEGEARRMGGLVEDLLLLAALDELPELRRAPVDLSELAAHTAEDTRAIAPTREVQLRTNGPLWVLADTDQLRQVLANLTRNAVIHTPPDTPLELRVGVDGGRAVLAVRDHGPGLAAGAASHVFDRFWRSEGGRARGRGGAGLGLAIVKAIVTAHHGHVDARNAPGGGAEFIVTLPLIDADGDGSGPEGALDSAVVAFASRSSAPAD
jgi:two-component system OmpR family sensor kinase